MILHYIITAWRSIMKFKTQNIIAVLGLSVALFCFSICLYLTRYIYDIDGCFENRDRIVEFSLQNSEMRKGSYMAGVPKEMFQIVKPHMELNPVMANATIGKASMKVTTNSQM